jgi:hypothetical protein
MNRRLKHIFRKVKSFIMSLQKISMWRLTKGLSFISVVFLQHLSAFGAGGPPGMAFGLNPFLDPRPQTINGVPTYFRSDFMGQITTTSHWSGVSGLASEYEMYFETLQGAKA